MQARPPLITDPLKKDTAMAIYDGTYRWDGTKQNDQEPIAWSPGAYDVKIYKRDSTSQKVELLKPFVCIYARTGEGQSISANPEKFVKQLCAEFSLEPERVLWVEDLQRAENRYDIIMLTRSSKIGKTVFYKIEKRKPSALEREQLENELRMFSS